MKRAITSAQMQQMEKRFMDETGYPGLLLMEHASQAVAREALKMTDGAAVFFCGPGNNGGDGYAAARLFAAAGRRAEIIALSDPDGLKGDALVNAQLCRALGLPIRLWQDGMTLPAGCGLCVDALFGTGLCRALEGKYADAVRLMNGSGLPVLAVDMPSGTPELMVRANTTVTFHKMKTCHLLFPGRENAGRILVEDIGFPWDDEGFEVMEDADVPRLLLPRPMNAHKGTSGHTLIFAGSEGMAGAAALCANAAMRAGTGLCTVYCAQETLSILQTLAPCATCAVREKISLADALRGKAAVAAGPGLGRKEDVSAWLSALCAEKNIPQIWDADALNWLSENPQALGGNFVITPHPGEAARLLGSTVREITAEPVAAAEALSEKYACTALLKGATTVIVGQGRRAMNISGTPGMAGGGSGDVLTGMIAALLAQGISPFDAAQLGAFLHGRAGECAANARGVRSMTAMDLLEALRIE